MIETGGLRLKDQRGLRTNQKYLDRGFGGLDGNNRYNSTHRSLIDMRSIEQSARMIIR